MEFAFYTACSAILIIVVIFDLNKRIIPNLAILSLIVLRLLALCCAFAGLLNWSDWGPYALSASLFTAVILMLLVLACAWVIGKVTKANVLGAGDVKLYAACMLWLSPISCFLFLFLSSLFGTVLALAYRLLFKERTFPFAPAIVLAFFVSLMTEFFWL